MACSNGFVRIVMLVAKAEKWSIAQVGSDMEEETGCGESQSGSCC
jgi:hypothetical protein